MELTASLVGYEALAYAVDPGAIRVDDQVTRYDKMHITGVIKLRGIGPVNRAYLNNKADIVIKLKL